MPQLLEFIIGFVFGVFTGLVLISLYLYIKLDFHKIKVKIVENLKEQGVISEKPAGGILEPMTTEQEDKLKNKEWEDLYEQHQIP